MPQVRRARRRAMRAATGMCAHAAGAAAACGAWCTQEHHLPAGHSRTRPAAVASSGAQDQPRVRVAAACMVARTWVLKCTHASCSRQDRHACACACAPQVPGPGQAAVPQVPGAQAAQVRVCLLLTRLLQGARVCAMCMLCALARARTMHLQHPRTKPCSAQHAQPCACHAHVRNTAWGRPCMQAAWAEHKKVHVPPPDAWLYVTKRGKERSQVSAGANSGLVCGHDGKAVACRALMPAPNLRRRSCLPLTGRGR